MPTLPSETGKYATHGPHYAAHRLPYLPSGLQYCPRAMAFCQYWMPLGRIFSPSADNAALGQIMKPLGSVMCP